MITESKTRTGMGNLVAPCLCRGRKTLGAKMVIVASDNKSVHDWIYRYLEPYEPKGHAFYQVENESHFFECAGKSDTDMAFVEDVFFGERTIGRLDYIHKQYPKLRLVLFSASILPLSVAARYVWWSMGSYFSLRDNESEIKESVEAIFGKRQAIPSYLKEYLDEYGRFPDINPHLTHREIEIVRCCADEKTATEVAMVLMLSKKTVQNHISNIYAKFGIRNMVGVLKLAVSIGILPVKELMTSMDKLK